MIGENDMGAAEHIKAIAKDKKIIMGWIGERMGMTPHSFHKKMNRNTMTFTDAEKIAEILGCEIIFKDKETGKEY